MIVLNSICKQENIGFVIKRATIHHFFHSRFSKKAPAQSSPPPTISADLGGQLEDAGIVPFSISSSRKGEVVTPCKLQYIGHRIERGRTMVCLSDGSNSMEVAVLDVFSIVFTKNKIALNQIVNVMKLGQRGGELTMMSFRVMKVIFPKLGEPTPLVT